MENFKEFQGKDLDECISQACEYYNCPREKLEIEIIQDAKSGIFGIVGARKAKIRARRMRLDESVQTLLDSGTQRGSRDDTDASRQSADLPGNDAGEASNVREKAEKQKNAENHRLSGNRPKAESAQKMDAQSESPVAKGKIPRPSREKNTENADLKLPKTERPPKRPHGEQRKEALTGAENGNDADQEFSGEDYSSVIAELDPQKVESTAQEIMAVLLKPLAGQDVDMSVDLSHGSVRVKVDWRGDAGLLIGREGQTLAAVQYLAARMLSKKLNAPLRVQVDIGDYRSRQEYKLKELARALADKARQNGRSFSTRPLSSYHRRIIHVYLQDDPDVHTRSSGDGPLKRVIISPRKDAERS